MKMQAECQAISITYTLTVHHVGMGYILGYSQKRDTRVHLVTPYTLLTEVPQGTALGLLLSTSPNVFAENSRSTSSAIYYVDARSS